MTRVFVTNVLLSLVLLYQKCYRRNMKILHDLYVYCIEMHIYSTYIVYRSTCSLIVQSYTLQDKVINPLSLRKCTVLTLKSPN